MAILQADYAWRIKVSSSLLNMIEIMSKCVFVEPLRRRAYEVYFAPPVLVSAGSLQDDKCESFDLLVPYQ